MNVPESSSRRVPYDLRPRKQVERRMMVHVFQLLSEAGFPISTYRYTGFGAFFFVDFILFRRLVGITDMVSIEHDMNNVNRVLFNRPFKDIDVIFQTSSEYIFSIDRDKPHILWLDYDGAIEHYQLVDIETAASTLSSGSILIVTFDVDSDKAGDIKIRESSPDIRPHAWYNRFREESGEHFNPAWKDPDFCASEISKRTTEVTKSAIISGLSMRKEISFELLFNFLYADGHEMLTIGGIICSKQDQKKLRSIEWDDVPFVSRKWSLDPFRIDVPVFTRKERLHLDSHMPCEPGWSPSEFEISKDAIEAYCKIHRYCPLYAELLL
jgi:hypothetical protein